MKVIQIHKNFLGLRLQIGFRKGLLRKHFPVSAMKLFREWSHASWVKTYKTLVKNYCHSVHKHCRKGQNEKRKTVGTFFVLHASTKKNDLNVFEFKEISEGRVQCLNHCYADQKLANVIVDNNHLF